MKEAIESYIQDLFASYGISVPEGSFVTFLILVVVLTIIFQIVLMLLRKITRFAVGKTATTLDDELLHLVSGYFPPIAVFTALFISAEVVYPDLTIGKYTEFDIYLMLLLAVLAFVIGGAIDIFLVWYGIKIQPPKRKQISRKKIFPFVRNVVRIAIYALFGIFILQIAGFDTTALITGLGIGGLAVALALQGTLSNFFGGMHILLDKPFREGDYIILDNGREGVVDRIGWRTTKILTLGKDEVIVPNAKLAESVILNESTPKDETGVFYTIGVSYDSDIDKVIETIKKTIKNVEKKNENLVPDTAWARLDSYGDYALNFKFGYLVYGYKNQYGVLADVNREIFREFKKSKIDIPYPVMVVKKQNGKRK
jgi:small-conductance mechanosensitive channel